MDKFSFEVHPAVIITLIVVVAWFVSITLNEPDLLDSWIAYINRCAR